MSSTSVDAMKAHRPHQTTHSHSQARPTASAFGIAAFGVLAEQVGHRLQAHAYSALPDAPVQPPSRPRRRPARALRSAMQFVVSAAPKRRCAECN